MIRGVLEADGIPAALLDTQVAGLGLGPAAGGVRVLVPARDLWRARELLSAPVPTGELDLAATRTPPPGQVVGFDLPAASPGFAERRYAVVRFLVWAALLLAALAVLARIG